MVFDFDKEVLRYGTGSLKWEFVRRDGKFVYGDWTHPQYGDQRLLPLWLADMDL